MFLFDNNDLRVHSDDKLVETSETNKLFYMKERI